MYYSFFWVMVKMAVAKDFRGKTPEELLVELEHHKNELKDLRVFQATRDTSSKLSKIKGTRKTIARILTVYSEQKRAEAQAFWSGKKMIPKDLRPKLTRKIRRMLKPSQLNAKTSRHRKNLARFPPRRYALLPDRKSVV